MTQSKSQSESQSEEYRLMEDISRRWREYQRTGVPPAKPWSSAR